MTAASEVFVDVGKSTMRLHALAAGRELTVTGHGMAPTEEGDRGERIGREIARLLAEAEAEAVAHLLIGSTTDLSPVELRSLVCELRPAVPAAVIAVGDDGTLAHARTLNAPGTLLAVGTGVIAIARAANGTLTRLDGWGPLSGDRGSAVEVGRLAMRAAFLAADERRPSGLRQAVEEQLGGLDLATTGRVLADPRWPAHLAELAVLVCRLADDGDDEAAALLDDAVAELVRTARAASRAAGSDDILVTGRFGTSPAVDSRMRPRLLESGLTPVLPLPAGAVPAAEIVSGAYAPHLVLSHPEAGLPDA